MMEWTDESITRLRSLWAEGLSTAEIGRRMQITKNAVVGKAHRLTLSPRPSPIRKGLDASNASPQPRRTPAVEAPSKNRPDAVVPLPVVVVRPAVTQAPAVTTRPVDNVQPIRPAAAPSQSTDVEDDDAHTAGHDDVIATPLLRPVSPPARRRGLTCCWPLGEPGTKQFHFCGGDPITGKPYCSEHAALAYVKLRDRRDSVA